MKKLLVVLIGFFLVFSASSTSFAAQPNTSNNITASHLEIIQNALNTPNPYGTPAQITNNESQDSFSTQQATVATITPVFIRASSTSSVVYVYLAYVGNKPANAIKFSKFDIMHKSWLNRTVYKSFSAKTYNFGVVSNVYTQYIGTASIPTSETEVRISDSGLMAYIPSSSSGWLSFSNIVGQWPIQ
ncbi:hypothetical protein [Sutcliffiella cohnii]|uniref:hypothetical protein n=1 Tax=Sutcliffiella cohnii TaxID=33932 RepID=UPI002E1E290D|nr:hypothetical protein [Sutcliffiella cohnii]